MGLYNMWEYVWNYVKDKIDFKITIEKLLCPAILYIHTHTSKQSQDEHYLDPKKKTSKFKEKMMFPSGNH